jgi:hypothetical protein
MLAMNSFPRKATAVLAVAAAALLALPAVAQGYDEVGSAGYENAAYGDSYGDAQAGYDSGYSYVRNLRGSATLIEGDSRDRQAAEVNTPILAGDRLWVSPGSMVEVLLSDGNLLRVDGDSEVLLARLAGSPESRDEATELVLVEGNLQLVVFADAAGRELPRIELPDATVYVSEAGAYRFTAGRGWSSVLARSGWAEVATDRGSVVVRAGEEAVLDGGGRADVRAAAYLDDLERWGERLDRQVADHRYVDRSLRYQAASLDGHGTWIDDGGRHLWRPRVAADWHPYWHGRWRHTPLGLTWVSQEPWGWAPYHYGTWDHHSRWGWVWYPGTAFSPAWVYWYWGPEHVAWVPIGYYTHHYRHYRRPGFRFGVYGWAGGHWGIFNDWVFCPTGSFGRPFQDRHHWRGRDWRRHHGDRDVPRGIIAIDTRPLGRDDWRDGERAIRALRSRPTVGGGVTARGGELPDVTDFVARKRELPDDVARRVFVDPDAGARVRVAGTPLAPDAAGEVRPRAAVPRGGGVRGDGVSGSEGDGRTRDAGAPRARVTPRTPEAQAPRGGDDSPGVRVRPRADDPAVRGGDEGGASGVRTRRIAPRGGDAVGDDGGTSGVRTRRIGPEGGARNDAQDDGGGATGVRPRRIEPREPAGGTRATAPRTGEPRPGGQAEAPRSAVRPRSIEPRRPAGDAERPAAPQRSRPSVRPRGDDDGDDGRRSFGATAPRATTTPDAYARSPRSRASAPSRPPVVVPPRSERRGVDTAPPARRVVGGVREAPSRPRPSAPRATRPTTPRRPTASSPRSSGSSTSRGDAQRGARSRSRDDDSGSRSGATTRSSSGGSDGGGNRARATRRRGGGGGGN